MNGNSDFGSSLFKALKQILVGSLLLWNVSACATTETINWKEEVVLHDGKTIVVNRSVTLGGNIPREIGQGPGESNYTLSFTAPDGREIDWENPGKLSLMILDFADSMPYLATRPAMVSHYFDYGCPEPAYVFFRYDNSWQRIEYKDFPMKFAERNLSASTGNDQYEIIRQGYMSSASIQKILRNRNLRRYSRSIEPNHHSPHPPCPLVERFDKVAPNQIKNTQPD